MKQWRCVGVVGSAFVLQLRTGAVGMKQCPCTNVGNGSEV